MGIEVPEEYGGAGMDMIAYVLAMIEIAKADASPARSASTTASSITRPKFGTEEQKRVSGPDRSR